MDVYNLGKTEVILRIPWLAAYYPEINWEKGEVKMTRCPPIYGRRKKETQEKRHVGKIEEEKTVEKLVLRRFWKWKKVFRKEESERMPTCNRIKGEICAKKGESVFAVKRGKRGGTGICGGSTAKGIYLTIKITTDLTSPFCSKEEWKEENGIRLSSCKSVDGKE